jgi:ABC-type transport system involved in multi-copper enzyme maturation permease subunit
MKLLLLKEIRLLLPGWALSLLLALAAGVIPQHPYGEYYDFLGNGLSTLLYLLCPGMLLVTTLSSFGGEFAAGTFSQLLALPVSRRRVWWTKTLLLAAAVLSIWLTWCLAYGIQEPARPAGWYSAREMWLPTALFALALYSGGLWTMLLFRQVAAAFWFTVLTPAALLLALADLLQHQPDRVMTEVIGVVFAVYGLAGFLLAWRLYFRAQDAQWTGGTFTLPETWGRTWFKIGSGESRLWHPRKALWHKELHLHQSLFLLAGGMLLLHLGALAIRQLGHFPKNSTEEGLLESIWIIWLVMPLVAGCAAVAEERKFGTLEGQLCLPAKRRTQFAVKLSVTLALAVLLGTIVPWLLEGARILPDVHFNADELLKHYHLSGRSTAGIFGLTLLNICAWLSPWLPLFALVLLAIGVAGLAFYASTLGRNTLQALGLAALCLLITWLLSVAALPGMIRYLTGYPLWYSGLIYLIGVPVMMAVLAALAYWNFKRVLVSRWVWQRNLSTIAFALALVALVTTALYQRAWELLTPLEPPHGAARLTDSARLSASSGGSVLVFLPNGSGWVNRYRRFAPNPFQDKTISSPALDGGRFLAGTNWADLKVGPQDIVGIRRDGSLWVSETPERPVTNRVDEKLSPAPIQLVRFGNDHDWKAVAGYNTAMLLLKTDGTLWQWGPAHWNRNQAWPGLPAFEPQRLGTNSDWSEFFTADYHLQLRKTDGSAWALDLVDQSEGGGKTDWLALERRLDLAGSAQCSTAEIWFYGMPFRLGVCKNGTLRILTRQQWDKHRHTLDMVPTDLPLGEETNWIAVASGYQNLITLKRDGSLWLWNFESDPFHSFNTELALRQMQNTVPVRLGTHSDWIAIGHLLNGVVALAADGSLWLWRPERFTGRLLSASRKPTPLGNIFKQAD